MWLFFYYKLSISKKNPLEKNLPSKKFEFIKNNKLAKFIKVYITRWFMGKELTNRIKISIFN